eukprot:558005-Pleurochrysis_carterae.AAC.2
MCGDRVCDCHVPRACALGCAVAQSYARQAYVSAHLRTSVLGGRGRARVCVRFVCVCVRARVLARARPEGAARAAHLLGKARELAQILLDSILLQDAAWEAVGEKGGVPRREEEMRGKESASE